MFRTKIAVIGGGYVGLVSGACLASLGHQVTIIEIDAAKACLINEKTPPLHEESLGDLLALHGGVRLTAVTSCDPVADADLTLICVGTPPNPDGSADLGYVASAAASIGNALRRRSTYHVVVVKSTVPPGTTDRVVRPAVLSAAGKGEDMIGFAMNPEFLREGRAVEDFLHPDRIVIGSRDPAAGECVKEMYRKIPAPVITTGIMAAEMIKYASNAFLATKISFANEIGNVCKELGIDVYEVMKGVGLDHRIGGRFLDAGVGFGGSCFPKDLAALVHIGEEHGVAMDILRSVIRVNTRQPERLVDLLEDRMGPVKGRKIAVLGCAFKDHTDDVRDSQAIPVIRMLLERGAVVSTFDPVAMENMRAVFPSITYCPSAGDALRGADACLVLTEWPEFGDLDKEFNLMAGRTVIEGRRVLRRPGSEGICW